MIWTYLIYSIVLSSLRRWYRPIKRAKVFPFISIVIPTYNEEEVIKEKIANTKTLDYPKNRVELLVIDSNSTDKTVEVAKELSGIKIAEEEVRLGKSHSINKALKIVSGEVVIITDADCFALDEKLLVYVAENFADESVGAVAGIPEFSGTKNLFISRGLSKNSLNIMVNESQLDSIPTGFGEFLAFRKILVEKLDTRCLSDDVDICTQVRSKGYRVIYDPRIKLREYAPDEFKIWYEQTLRRKINTLTTAWHKKNMFFKHKYGFYGMLIMPTALLFHQLTPFFVLASLSTLLVLNPLIAILLSLFTLASCLFFPLMRKFLMMQLVILNAWIFYALGKYKAAWDKEPHSTVALD